MIQAAPDCTEQNHLRLFEAAVLTPGILCRYLFKSNIFSRQAYRLPSGKQGPAAARMQKLHRLQGQISITPIFFR